MKFLVPLILALCFLSTACTQQKVSFETTEDARSVAKANAKWNAQKWRADSPLFGDWDIIARGDSTQTPTCPQGDGWASVDMISPDKRRSVGIKCSTVSPNISCLTAEDFKGKAQYSGQENSCDRTLPFPLPKIAQ